MFSREIRETVFSGHIANSMMSKINYNNGAFMSVAPYDVTLLSTMRAVLYDRMAEGETIYINGYTRSVSPSDLNSYSVERLIEHFAPNMDDEHPGRFHINNFGNDRAKSNMDYVEEHFLEVHPDFVRINKVTDFFKKSFRAICYIRPSLKQVVLFLPKITVSQMHFLQCAIPAMFPWYFPEERGLSAEEMNIFKALEKTSYTDYIDALNVISAKYDFRSIFIKETLKGCESIVERRRKGELERNIDQISGNIREYMRYLSEKLQLKNRYETELLGVITKINSTNGESELCDYFCCNKSIELVNLNGTEITFYVKDYIDYYDEDLASRVINNSNSLAYKDDCGRYYDQNRVEGMKKLLTEIFINKKLRVRTCAAYYLSLDGGCGAIRSYGFDPTVLKSYIPNTHIQQYECMGGYTRIVSELAQERKHVECIEQCIASARSLNFGDGIVFRQFMRSLYEADSSKKFIELPDKSCVSVSDAIKWVEANHDNK